MQRILILLFLVPYVATAEHKSVLEDNDTKIQFVDPDFADFSVGLSGSGEGEATSVSKVGRKDDKHKNSLTTNTDRKADDSKNKDKDKKDEQKKDTQEYVVNVKYDGKEGWVRAQYDPSTGKVESATFSPNYEGSGQSLGTSMLGPNGKQIPLTQENLKAAALGKGQFSIDGKQLTEIGSGGGGSGSGGGC